MGLPCSIRSPFIKTAAGTLSLLYFIGNVALAHSAETNFWSDRRRSAAHGNTGSLLACVPSLRLPALAGGAVLPPQIDPHLPENIRRGLPPEFLKAQDDLLRSLPYAEGSVRKISVPSPFSPEGPVVVHIQDIHRNFEAQRRIAAAVAALAKQADVVGLEGSTRAIDLARFRAFPDHNAVAIAAEESLAQNEITGPIHAALTGSEPFPAVIGIDDPIHYTANIEAYQQSAPFAAEEKQKLASLNAACEIEKQHTFNPALKRFDQQVTDYREGRIPLSTYLKALTEGDPNPSPEIRRFKDALSLEESLDFQAVECERAKAVDILSARLDADSVAQLTARGIAYRAGTLRYGEFYRFLKDLCERHGISFGKNLGAYVRYVLLADSVEAGALFDELQAMETRTFLGLTKSPAEAALMARSRRNYLAGKLIDFSLTPKEWKEYQALPKLNLALSTFESFYREAHTRDGAMAANLLAALNRVNHKKKPVALLVTGGYHAPGLTDQLTRAGAAVISFVPKIEKVDTADGPIALGIFTQEKTPLQKLFEGEKLFLGQDPMPLEAEQLGVPAKITALGSLEPADSLNRLVPKPLMKLILFIKREPPFFSIRMKTHILNVSVNLDAPVGKRLVSSVVAIGTATALWVALATGFSDILVHLYDISKELLSLSSRGFPFFVGMISFIPHLPPTGIPPRGPPFFETTVRGVHFRLPTVRAYTFSQGELDAFFGDSSAARAPLVLDLNFPSGCNARCLYCFTEAGRSPHEIRFNAQAVKPKLNPHDTQEIIRQFAEEGGRVVFLCSEGEPLTNPKKFLELAHLAKSNGLRVITFTNMITITPEFARQLREAEVSLVVKFEHLDPKINSAIIRPTSDYAYVEWKGQHVPKPFVDLWNAYDGAHDMLAVSSMVTKKNVDNLLSIRRWAYEELGIAHFVKKVNFHGFAERNRSELELTMPETRAFERELSEYDAQFGFTYPAELPDAYSFDIRRFLNNAINPNGFPARMYFHPRDGSYHSAGLVQPVFAVSPQVEVNIRSQSGEIALGNFFQTVQETIHLYRSLLEGKEEEFWDDVQRGPTELDSERRNDRREAAYQASRVLGKFLRLNWSVLDLRQRDLLQGLFYDSKRLARESTLYSVPSRPGLYRVPKAELRRALPKGEEFMFFSLHRKFPFYSSPYQVTVALTPPHQEQEIHGHFLTRELTVSLGEGLFFKVFRFKGGEVREEEKFPIPPFYGTDYGARTPHLIGNDSGHPVRNITVKYGQGVVDRWSLEEGPSEQAYTYDRAIKIPEVFPWGEATVYEFRKPQITSRIFVIPPGKSMAVPFDPDGERGLFFAQGQAQGSDGKERVDLMEGDILYAIRREGAAVPLLKNIGNEPAIIYAVDLAENRDKGLQFPVRRWKGLSPSLFPLGIGTIWMGRVWPEGDENYQIPKKEELEKYLNDAFHLTAGSSDRLMIDTAAGYGHSERHLGAYFRTHPVEFNRALIATKWGVRYDPESGLSSLDHSVENLDASLTQSAQDLGRVDVLYIHGTTVEVLGDQAVWRRMREIRESHEGGVQAIGVSLSNRNGESVLEALTNSDALKSLDVVQLPGDVLLKRPDLVRQLTNRGVAIVLHSPMKLPMQAPPCDKYRALLGDGSAPIVLTGTRAHLDETIHYVVENDGEPNVSAQLPPPLHGGVMHWVQDLWNRSVPSTLKMDRRRWHRWAFLTEGVLSLVVGGVVAAAWVAITGDYGHLSTLYSKSVLGVFVGGHFIDLMTPHRAQAPPHILISFIIAGFSSLPLVVGGPGWGVLFLFFSTHWFVNWIMARFQSTKPAFLSRRVPVQVKSGPSVKELAEKEVQNTASVSGLMNAWPYQGSLQMRQADSVRWLRAMRRSLRLSAFRETYKIALTDQRNKFSPFDGPTDLFNRFISSLTGGVPGSARVTVPLDIVSGNDLGGVARMLDHMDFINQGSKIPIQIVFAGETPEDVQKLRALKLNGPRGYVHVVDVPVAPKSVLDPHVLAQGIERLADFPTNVPVSWVLAVSPNISINPSTLGSLGDRGLAGSLKEALARYIAQLMGGRLKPADLNTLVDIVALAWRSA